MSHENVETVKRFLDLINDGELDAALSSVTADAMLDWSRSDAPDGGTHAGREAWRTWMSSRWEGLPNARFGPTELLDLPPNRVLIVAHMSGKGRASGLEIKALAAAVVTLRSGSVSRLTLYQSRAEALKAVGLEE